MASQQVTSKKTEVQCIMPKDFKISYCGDGINYGWRLPTASDPTAELIMEQKLDVKVTANIDPAKDGPVLVGFTVSLEAWAGGFEKADIRIGAKVGEDEDYKYKSINLNRVIGKSFKTVSVALDLNRNPGDDKIHFGLFALWDFFGKNGLKLHDARVVEL